MKIRKAEKHMAEKNEPEKRSPAIYQALPELRDQQSMAIAAHVEDVLQMVMEMEQVTTDQLQEFLERLGQHQQPGNLSTQRLREGAERTRGIVIPIATGVLIAIPRECL